jgi:hypothetical protein
MAGSEPVGVHCKNGKKDLGQPHKICGMGDVLVDVHATAKVGYSVHRSRFGQRQ